MTSPLDETGCIDGRMYALILTAFQTREREFGLAQALAAGISDAPAGPVGKRHTTPQLPNQQRKPTT